MWWVQQHIYDSLLRKAPNGAYKPGLAKSATIVDPSTIEIELFPGQKFSDGTPLDAEAVKFSLERAKNSGNGSLRADILQLGSVTVNSPTNLTISLLSPVANTFYDLLAYGETFIVSPTAARSGTPLDQQPVGAGPFMVESISPESEIVFVKNPNFREAKKVKNGGFTLKQVSSESVDPQALVNSMLDGIGDASFLNNLSSVAPLESGGIEVDQVATDSSTIFGPMCKNQPPFDDVRVRQAINYATDRDQINELLYQGTSEPTWATWTKGNALFNKELDGYYDYNPKKAKKLLKQAGVEGLEFDMIANTTPDTSRVAEILKEQWAESGITVNLTNTTNIVQDFFTDAKTKIAIVPVRRLGLDKITRNLQPGSIGNVCGFNDPELNALIDAVKLADPSSAEYKQAWADLDAYVTENALFLHLVFAPTANAYNADRIVKPVYRPDVFGLPRFDLSQMQVKS
jgi:ABC-type transport system substrate-binding protein